MMKRLFFGHFIFWAVVIVVIAIYFPLIRNAEIIGGDWPYRFSEMVGDLSRIPTAWQSGYGGGLGGISPAYFLNCYNSLSAWISVASGLPWVVVYKIFWFFTPIILLFSGGYVLFFTLYPTFPLWVASMASLILSTNTYVLMIIGGGQMGVFYAVSLFPWVLISFFRFLRIIERSLKNMNRLHNWFSVVLLGTVFGIQVSLDPRIAYLSAISMGVLYVFRENGLPLLVKRLGFFVSAGIISVLLNVYWIVPLILLKENTLSSLGGAYTTVDALRFFSFADFSHAFSLLHPNWPENLFGKTYFLQPEFLFLPIFALLSLLVTPNQKKNMTVIGFVMLGLVGAFLSKGANEPFGIVYVWAFEHIPGFVMFRDPTKFYVLTMTSYALLIPFSLFMISQIIKKYMMRYIWFTPFVFICFWLFLIRPVVYTTLGGTFTKRAVPSHYITLKEMLQKEKGFFRTLWIPRQSRFTFTSSNHLSIEAGPLLGATDAASLKKAIETPSVKEQLDMLSIRYIIVPSDPYGEIFVDDRAYSQIKRNEIETVLDSVLWLTKIQLDDISIYQTPRSKDRIWLESGIKVNWKKISDDYYIADVNVSGDTKLMFSESYHTGWQAQINGETVKAQKESFGIMSFALPRQGSHKVLIEFAPRQLYRNARIISLSVLGVVALYIFFFLLVYAPQLTYNDKS